MTATNAPKAQRRCAKCDQPVQGGSAYCSRPCLWSAKAQEQKQERRDAAYAELRTLRREVEQLRELVARYVPQQEQRRYGLRPAVPALVPGRPDTWPDILSTDQVAQAVGYSESHVSRLLRNGRLRGHRPPGARRWIIKREHLIEDLQLTPHDMRGKPRARA